MTTARQIAAYEKRLSKIDVAHLLTSECLNAVIAWEQYVEDGGEVVIGTITGYRITTAQGLFGLTIDVHVDVCRACVGGPGGNACKPETVRMQGGTEVALVRNDVGAREAAAAALARRMEA